MANNRANCHDIQSKIAPKFGVSEQAARVPQLTFLVFYALGCQLWAPWSEEKGRWGVQYVPHARIVRSDR